MIRRSVWTRLKARALVLLGSQDQVTPSNRHQAILFTLQVALDRVVRDVEAMRVLDELRPACNLCPLKDGGSAFLHFDIAIHQRVADIDRNSLLSLNTALHVQAVGN